MNCCDSCYQFSGRFAGFDTPASPGPHLGAGKIHIPQRHPPAKIDIP
jgi:hypothetical protein